MPIELKPVAEALTEICAALQPVDTQNVSFKAVSYTHLTLPTKA